MSVCTVTCYCLCVSAAWLQAALKTFCCLCGCFHTHRHSLTPGHTGAAVDHTSCYGETVSGQHVTRVPCLLLGYISLLFVLMDFFWLKLDYPVYRWLLTFLRVHVLVTSLAPTCLCVVQLAPLLASCFLPLLCGDLIEPVSEIQTKIVELDLGTGPR